MAKYRYTQCRTFGHAWRPTTVDKYVPSRSGTIFVQHLECRNCETAKSVRIAPNGSLKGASYLYPNDYRLEGRNTSERNAKMRRDYLGI